MSSSSYEIQAKTNFSESLIWQLNRDFYHSQGIEAWREGAVPHHLSSNAMVGRTYADLIFAFLKDLAAKGQTTETVYLLELGAGQGRLAFHILQHLEQLIEEAALNLPPYCYILSDIIADSLQFFEQHPQFQTFFEQGKLDVAFFNGLSSKTIQLKKKGIELSANSLQQPLIAIANYFFDSIPSDLFHFEGKKIASCQVALNSTEDPNEMDEETLLKNIQLTFHTEPLLSPFYQSDILNELLENYRGVLFNSFLFFPQQGIQCLFNLQQLSKKGLMLLSMDKGFHEMHDLENSKEPEMITHGSMSFWVNYHTLGAYCKKDGGTALFPSFSNFHLDLACLLFLPESENYRETKAAYRRSVDEFGPDDFNSFKRFTYKHIAQMGLLELLGMIRLFSYDSAFFINILPRLRQVTTHISFNERRRLGQVLRKIWEMYFTLNESYDLAFELAGLFYDLGYYQDALTHYAFSTTQYGQKADIYYNIGLCYYQLREDVLFAENLKTAKLAFPAYERYAHLDKLDLKA